MDKLIIESTEGRIMLGITMFVAIMILVGWIAINEPARMASFEEQNLGRSIERGGELFAAFCSSCHGVDGTGVGGKGPGLNNPHLFGYSYIGIVNDEIIRRQREIFDLEALDSPTQDDLDRIDELNAELNTEYDGGKGLLAQRDDLLKQLGAPILNGYLPNLPKYQAELEAGGSPLAFSQNLAIDANRLTQVGWGGSLDGYIRTTLIHGRPGSNNIWPDPMVSWSQRGGGPMRDDQINDLVNYITNFDKGTNWTLADFENVKQYARLHYDANGAINGGDGGGDENLLGPTECSLSDSCVAGVGTVQEIAAALPEGDAANGANLYTANGCIGCHAGAGPGPDLAGTAARIESERLPAQDGEWTADEYIVASILYPNYYVGEGLLANVMPATFGQTLTIDDLADLVAYIKSQ